jgi:K(+)-stimulated pyrophosphate-energized sodium pump
VRKHTQALNYYAELHSIQIKNVISHPNFQATLNMNTSILYLIPALGLVGLIVMAIKSAWVSKQDAGDEKMQNLAGKIARGAMAFLRAEWKVLSYFAIIAAALLAYSGTIKEVNGVKIHSHWIIAVAFLIGAFLSALAGYFGMNIATKANVRTTQAARSSLSKALNVSFSGGTVMGLGVAGFWVAFSLFFTTCFMPAVVKLSPATK